MYRLKNTQYQATDASQYISQWAHDNSSNYHKGLLDDAQLERYFIEHFARDLAGKITGFAYRDCYHSAENLNLLDRFSQLHFLGGASRTIRRGSPHHSIAHIEPILDLVIRNPLVARLGTIYQKLKLDIEQQDKAPIQFFQEETELGLKNEFAVQLSWLIIDLVYELFNQQTIIMKAAFKKEIGIAFMARHIEEVGLNVELDDDMYDFLREYSETLVCYDSSIMNIIPTPPSPKAEA
jgi:hypothetical protein